MVSFPSMLNSGAIRLTDGSTTVDAAVRLGKNNERMFSASTTPTQEGDPTTPFALEFGFGYGGIGASDYPITGMHDRSTMDARNLGFLYPRPLRSDVDVSTSSTIRAIWVAGDSNGTPYVYYAGGTTLVKVRVSDAAGQGTASLTAGAVTSQAVTANGKWYIPMGGSQIFRELTSVAVGNISGDTISAGAAAKYATAFTVGFAGASTTAGFSLVRGDGSGNISLCADESDPLVAGNWGTAYQISIPGQPVNGLVALGRFIYVLTPFGCYTTDEVGNGINLTPETAVAFSATNGLGGMGWHGAVLYPHRTGLYRVAGEVTQPIGLEEIPTFDGTIRGRVTAMAGFGKWVYFAMYDGTDTWIMCGRERQNGESGFGPMVYYSLEKLSSTLCEAMFVYGGADSIQPRLYFARGSTGLSFYLLGRTGGPDRTDTNLTYALSGSHWTSANDGGKPNTLKTATVAEYVAGGTLSASAYFQLQLSWDGASYAQIGANITASGWGQRFLTAGTNDSGRLPKMRIDYTSNSSTAPAYLKNGAVILRGRERPLRAELYSYDILLAEGDHVPVQGLTAEGMWTQLMAWQDAASVLTLSDKIRTDTTKLVQIRDISRVELKSDAGGRPAHGCTVTLQVLEYS